MDGAGTSRNRARWIEFGLLYLGVPLLLAFALPPDWLWPILFGTLAVALVLLALTPGFRWSELVSGWSAVDWRLVAATALLTAATAALLVWWLVPGQALMLPRRAPSLWLTILLLYPLLSALPQELIFRVLFFRRYETLLGGRSATELASSAIFALAHLFYWNWVAVMMTFAGGLIFARAYRGRGGFATVVILHAVCGWILFTSGLGSFFFHGAVGR